MKYRSDIQGLRGIAVLLVILYHLYPLKICGGYIGVDIFFVISGYLVCCSLENRITENNHSFYISFYSARIRRLVPSSLFTLVAVTLYIYKYDYVYFSVYQNDAIACLCVYANYHFYLNKVDYFHSSLKESTLLHYWSLSLEEQFYIISPIIISTFFNNLIKLYVILSSLSFFFCIYYGIHNNKKGYFFLSSRSWELILGALIRHIPRSSIDSIDCSNISIMAIIVLSVYYNDNIIYPSYNAIIPTFLSGYILFSTKKFSIITNLLICRLGFLSYSVYLIHFPLKYIVKNTILYYIILILFGNILHNFIEIPFYKGVLILSDILTLTISVIVFVNTYKLIKNLNYKSKNKLRHIEHYSSAEIMKILEINDRSYCCMKDTSRIYKSSILFIGDSHIEQYIAAIFKSVYKYKFHLVHIYINSRSYNNIQIKSYFSKILHKYHFSLCMFGNKVDKDISLVNINKMVQYIIPLCDKIILSNDNPQHVVDPNSCLKSNKNDCYGVLNYTCVIPRKFIKPINTTVNIVTLWDESIIYKNKCLYYKNNIPIYADTNHLSPFYLELILTKIIHIIEQYVKYDNEYKFNNKCLYYHMPNTNYVYENIYHQRCKK